MDQLILHLIGDYCTQSDWHAERKTKSLAVAGIHALLYSLPFLLIGSVQAVAVIFATHAVIDRYRLAVYLCYWKNRLFAPWTIKQAPFEECHATGYDMSVKPPWMAVWLMIAADNTMHLTINWLALRYL